MCRKKFEDTKKGLRQAVNQRKTENTVTNRKQANNNLQSTTPNYKD